MTKKIVFSQIFVLGMMLVLMLTGCSERVEQREIMIGAAWPFESNNSSFNEGIDLAVKELNSSGGINGRAIRLLKKDDGGDVGRGMAVAQSFAENKEVKAVIGHRNSFISIPASRIYNNAGLVMLSPASTAPELTKGEYKYIFRNIPSDDEIAKQLVSHAAKQGHRRMAVFYSDDAYGIGLANSFEDHARSQGITVVDRYYYYSSLEDLRRIHNKWQSYGFDGIFLAKSMQEGAQFIQDARKAGITVPMFTGNALDSPLAVKIAGKAAEGIVVGSIFNPNSDRPEVKKFVKSYMAEYKALPSSYAAQGYDAVKMLADALRKSDLLKHSTVAHELRNLDAWSGVTGVHKFDDNGDDLGDLVVLKKLLEGEFVYLEK